jgi:toxin-antitoxin system PIN domain toxin
MLLCDVNVLVYAYREDLERHYEYATWLDEVVNGARPFGVSDLVLSGFVRVVTHPRVLHAPSRPESALAFADAIWSAPNAVRITPGRRHWEIFTHLVRDCGARGNLVPDAYLAALAIESNCEWITTDRDYARFPGLRWRHPLEAL